MRIDIKHLCHHFYYGLGPTNTALTTNQAFWDICHVSIAEIHNSQRRISPRDYNRAIKPNMCDNNQTPCVICMPILLVSSSQQSDGSADDL